MSDQRYNYIRRSGRMTKAQTQGYDEDRTRYHCDLAEWNDRAKPLGIEIGFGMGQGLLDWAQSNPTWQLLGIELYKPGVGALAQGLKRHEINNVALIEKPAQEVFAALDAHSIAEIRIYFPDPWPKKRHAKRRLIQSDFVAAIARVLSPEGELKIATDWDPYADWIREVMSEQTRLVCKLDVVTDPEAETTNEDESPRDHHTKFEQRGRALGHRIHDLIYYPARNSATTESK